MFIQLIKRSRIRYKRKTARLWRKGKVRLDAEGTAELRTKAFERSGGQCEMVWPYERVAYSERNPDGVRCQTPITEESGEMHHVTRHGTRTDELEWVLASCAMCHAIVTGKLQWSKKQ